MTIGQSIKKAREAKGLSRYKLAEMAGIAPITIYQWERGAFCPTITCLIFIADALDISLDELVGRERGNEIT